VTGVPVEIRCPINANAVMDVMRVGDYVKFVGAASTMDGPRLDPQDYQEGCLQYV
jgi:hypothetical protein